MWRFKKKRLLELQTARQPELQTARQVFQHLKASGIIRSEELQEASGAETSTTQDETSTTQPSLQSCPETMEDFANADSSCSGTISSQLVVKSVDLFESNQINHRFVGDSVIDFDHDRNSEIYSDYGQGDKDVRIDSDQSQKGAGVDPDQGSDIEVESDWAFESDIDINQGSDIDPDYEPESETNNRSESDTDDETVQQVFSLNTGKQNLYPKSDGPEKVSDDKNTSSSTISNEECEVAKCVAGKGWDKKHCCVFCLKYYTKMARHFEQVHREETEVAAALSLPLRSKDRKFKWRELVNKGDFHHNQISLKNQRGSIIPRRRSTDNKDSCSYLPCPNCLGMFMSNELWRHSNKCPLKGDTSQKDYQRQAKLLLPISSEVSEAFRRDILSTLASGKNRDIITRDDTILLFGEKLFRKNAGLKHQHQYTKQKLRELSRFLLFAREENPSIQGIRDCINPAVFKDVVAGVKKMAGFDDTTLTYKIPSLCLKVGQSLKKCADCLKSTAIQTNNVTLKQQALDFIELYNSDWLTDVSVYAHQSMHASQFNRPKRIPLAKDLQLLNTYLEQRAEMLQQQLHSCVDVSVWRNLSEITLAQVVLFNRRRGGETERMELVNFEQGLESGKDLHDEVADGLSPFEKELTKTLERIEIRGKRGRRVPVILTKKLTKRIQCLIKVREEVGVKASNKYVFPRVGDAETPLRSHAVIHKFARECGAERPDLITSTALRKHIATVSQILNLKNNEMDALAGFLGHDIRVHRDKYRLSEGTIQLAKVSKLLLELEAGSLSKYKGKTLDEIQMDEEDELSETGENEEDDSDQDDTSLEPPSLEPPKKKLTNQSKTGHAGSFGKICQKKPWSEAEKQAVERQLGKYLRTEALPGKHDCETAKRNEPVLHNRPWTQIKFFIKNLKNSKRMKLKKHVSEH